MMNSLLRRAIPSVSQFSRQTVRLLSAEAGKPDFTNMVKKNKVVVFMKGIPDAPKCGFSNAVVQIMRMHGVNFDSYDVLEDEHIRQGIKDFSNWPTIPQVFINGEFVGGCDILVQMHKSGDLIEELKKVGIESELLKQEQEKTPK
uniref:Glutaredoxin-related protein 5, mitochondrial n=1 Tax=Lygus hesperus TaxID=30085 RepID=A0A0A9XU97_LYGHE